MLDVRIRLGDVLHLDAADRYRSSDGPVTLWVTGVRLVLNRPARDRLVWVEGYKISPSGRRGDQVQVLVHANRLDPSTDTNSRDGAQV